ncbi:MAG: bifunctional phosphoglucose/phosphomannose isomerase [Solirubrobacteraceae bacterium]|jgi:glucose/mannose-6-phosphate isomerase|nr:bifunctional phosphoglucose/phosphomannose isomerase [Solirubrobacteraceae bacterium]
MSSATPQPGTALDRDELARRDPSDQLTDVLAIPEHLRDALWKAESAGVRGWDSPGGLIVAGMGGSGIGGRIARGILGDQASRPVLSVHEYALPPWTTDEVTVLCTSYSGDTEETLACFEAAGVVGARRIVATTGGRLAEVARAEGVPVLPLAGGLQPRAAVAYQVVAALEAAWLCGAGPRMTTEIDVAAEHLEQLVAAWGPDAGEESEAKALARALEGSVPVLVGAGLTSPIAYRWKTQINENAKQLAFHGSLPELDHNEIVGWSSAERHGRFSAVFLDDCDDTPRVEQRIRLTREIIAEHAAGTHVVPSRGQTAVERAFSLILLGDLVSLYLAALNGEDPVTIEPIDRLKAALADGE